MLTSGFPHHYDGVSRRTYCRHHGGSQGLYRWGSSVEVAVAIAGAGMGKLELVGTVLIDAPEFMAFRCDTIIVPKTAIESVNHLPDKPLEEQLGATESRKDKPDRPQPPKVERVRVLSAGRQAPGRDTAEMMRCAAPGESGTSPVLLQLFLEVTAKKPVTSFSIFRLPHFGHLGLRFSNSLTAIFNENFFLQAPHLYS